MFIEKLTDAARKSLNGAVQIAVDRKEGWLGTEHLLLAICQRENGIFRDVLRSFGISPIEFSDRLRAQLGDQPDPVTMQGLPCNKEGSTANGIFKETAASNSMGRTQPADSGIN